MTTRALLFNYVRRQVLNGQINDSYIIELSFNYYYNDPTKFGENNNNDDNESCWSDNSYVHIL